MLTVATGKHYIVKVHEGFWYTNYLVKGTYLEVENGTALIKKANIIGEIWDLRYLNREFEFEKFVKFDEIVECKDISVFYGSRTQAEIVGFTRNLDRLETEIETTSSNFISIWFMKRQYKEMQEELEELKSIKKDNEDETKI